LNDDELFRTGSRTLPLPQVRDWLIFKADAKNNFIFFSLVIFHIIFKNVDFTMRTKKHCSFLLIYKIALSVGLCVYISMKTGIQTEQWT